MKKVLLCTMMIILALPMWSEDALPFTVRNGNTYLVGNEVMNKRAYQGYLKNTSPAAYEKFKYGHTLANVGWGLFGGGFAVGIGGLIAVNACAANMTKQDQQVNSKKLIAANYAVLMTGNAITLSGIVCLCVGYTKMHNSVDMYNVQAVSQNKPQAYWSIQTSSNGVGLAYNF